jgi:putative RNA 2'-phosphotransferase
MDRSRATSISKFLSLVLRHEPSAAGVALDPQGWVGIDELLDGCARKGKTISRDELFEIVAGSDKQRFALSDDRRRIRASQGHSVQVDLGYEPVPPPQVLFHGTVERFLESIREKGLLKGERHDVHLSETIQTATKVGQRRGKPVVLTIRAADMHRDGHQFRRSENGVWLTESVPAKYIQFPAL